jgi:hypothetical protein
MRRFVCLCAVVLVLALPAMAQDNPQSEIFGGYSYLHINPGGGAPGVSVPGGWGAGFTGYAKKSIGFEGEVSGHYKSFSSGTTTTKVSLYTYLFGVQIKHRAGKVEPFFHGLFGGAHVSAGGFGSSAGVNAFAMAFGGGVDVVASPHVAIRIGQFDYVPTHFAKEWQHNLAYSAGIVLRFGGK